MTLTEYFELRSEWLRKRRHPKTVAETGVAVKAFVKWFGAEIDIDDVTPALVEQFEAAEETPRRRQLTSNLLGLLRLYDPDSFPRRSKALAPHAKWESPIAGQTATTDKPQTLVEFSRQYVARRSLSIGYANILPKRAAKLEAFVGKSAIQDVLTEATVNAFLAAIVGTGRPATIRKYRQDLLTLWSAAADDDLVGYPIRRRIRREKPDPLPIECFTLDEVRSIVVAAEQLKGAFENGVARRHYWPAIVRAAWDTGLRRGDLWRFDKSCLQPDGTFRVVMSKTRKPIRRMLRPETVAALDKIGLEKPLAWPMRNEWSFSFGFQRILIAAGVDRGQFKWLRRAAGSHVEAEHPGAGHRALGNTTQVFNSHYNADLAGEVLMPPEL
jgi:integrase